MVWFGLRQRVESTSSSTLPTRPYLPTHLAYLLPQGIHLRAPCPSPQHPLALLPTPSTEPVPDQLAGRWSSSPVSSLAYPCSQKELNSTGVSLGPASDDYRSKHARSLGGHLHAPYPSTCSAATKKLTYPNLPSYCSLCASIYRKQTCPLLIPAGFS